ncbi:nuclear transport factor 2 family protein [Mycolicibacterium thermoresistibile]|uniref:SnoaL-like domain-containing protein n=1 Tax=Mycolicibacterium thermoresistibile TaxID=1797 RepID=A0A100XFE7_MYCTH|nr:nuclear transport factor 2 family protein [Mycolicibacterium thermoresistibile]MCV7191130.1 nuclear transport factor 2 family protein [Mycolicibacterium thermoresistibile]GAT15522.1 putative uncharacterized protein [Mycolicibacterium thermoresistibile]SNW16927.1 Ketosteroid isomerase-related protein [Mycolicibacterium thermoresistibile]
MGGITIVQRVDEILDRVQEFDFDAVLELFADDGCLELPYRPGGYPTVMAGRAELKRFLRVIPKLYAEVTFVERNHLPTSDPATVVTEYRGVGKTCVGNDYANRYIALFEFDDSGRCTLWREYFDPTVVTAALTPAGRGDEASRG